MDAGLATLDQAAVADGGALPMVGPMASNADMTDDLESASDERLLALYAQGHGRAAGALTARFLPRAYRLALRMLGQVADSEDVAQDAMIRLFAQAPRWQAGRAQVATWLYRVTANLCTDRLRQRGFQPLEAAAEIAAPFPGAEAQLSEKERLAALAAALGELPERQRLAVVLRHLEGRSNPEIALIMEIGVEAVESLMARGKRQLIALCQGGGRIWDMEAKMTETPDQDGLEGLLARMAAAESLPAASLIDRVEATGRAMQPRPQVRTRRGAGRWFRRDVWPAAGGLAAAGVIGFALGLGGLLDAAAADDGSMAALSYLPGNEMMGGALFGAADEGEE